MAETGRNNPIAKRLRILRRAEGVSKSSVWAARMGMSLQQLSNYENGRLLSRNSAITLAKRVPGLTLDWIYLGREEGLSVDLRRRLHEAALIEDNGGGTRNGIPRQAL